MPDVARPLVAANLCFIDGSGLTGPGYYAVQVFEHLLEIERREGLPFALAGYAQHQALVHFSDSAKRAIRPCADTRGRVRRVIYEQLVLPRRTRADGVDLLWSPAFVSPLWGAPRLTATICDMYYRAVPEVVERFQRIYWGIAIPVTARVCDRLITISEASKTDIVRWLPIDLDRVDVTPLASRLRLADFADDSSYSDEPPFFLLVANTTQNKNCERVVAALGKLTREGRNVRLVHVGRDHHGRLRSLARDAGLEERLISKGRVSDQELAWLYKHCSATVVASTYEGFGMPAAEAQAMGAPLVCSNISALPEAAGGLDCGGALFVDPFDVDDIADALGSILDEPPLRKGLADRGLNLSSMLTWEETARKTAASFAQTLQQ